MLDGECPSVGGAPRIVLDRYEDGALQVETRVISLKDPVKIGRAVGRHKPAADNGVFECRVLSRNQAILWHEDNRYFIKDTKSSNGTFVNNQRLAPEESYQIFSEDVLQFGIDVTEGGVRSHSCVITQITIFNADGTEVPKRSPQDCQRNLNAIYPMDIQLLLEESCRRQMNLRQKIYAIDEQIDAMLDKVNIRFEEAIDRDDLILRIGVLEKQLFILRTVRDSNEMEQELMKLTDEITTQSSEHRLQMLRAEEENSSLKREISALQSKLCELEDRLTSLQQCKASEEFPDEKLTAVSTREEGSEGGAVAQNGNVFGTVRFDVGTQCETTSLVPRAAKPYEIDEDYCCTIEGDAASSSDEEDDRMSVDTLIMTLKAPLKRCDRAVSPIPWTAEDEEDNVPRVETSDQCTSTEPEVLQTYWQQNSQYMLLLSSRLGLIVLFILFVAAVALYSSKLLDSSSQSVLQPFEREDL